MGVEPRGRATRNWLAANRGNAGGADKRNHTK